MNRAGRPMAFDTSVFPQIIGKFALLQHHAPFFERVTRSRLAPVYS